MLKIFCPNRVTAAGNRPMNHGLLLLVQQRDQLALRSNRSVQSPVCPVQEAHNRLLLVGWRYGKGRAEKLFVGQLKT
jgi:hypothetical protein